MCLGIPGKIQSISSEGLERLGKVDFSGIVKDVSLAFVPEAKVGDYVIVHVGVAISQVDEQEAAEIFRTLNELGEAAEMEAALLGQQPSSEQMAQDAINTAQGAGGA